ncbi:glycosyltransferase family 4 protein [Vibrio sp. MMG022]|uniref:glycosyltransferase family 4 protein n=1 Tax=Vibrio sp. MMG023 TaxID=2909979 RepID=UPI001F252CDA|nr:glycosyltransferase family 4 protein [Vibrio sp. MMG023]MCF6453906.1 glycosyltransferase family 4 protein [Vibrio sp. MMG023]
MSKKVYLITQEYPPKLGGAGSVAKNNVTQLKEIGLDVVLITSKSKFWLLGMLIKTCWHLILRSNNQKSVIINDLGAILVCGLVLPKKQLNNSIVYLHGSEMEIINNANKGGLKTTLIKFAFTRIIENVKNIICVSKYMKEKFSVEGATIFEDIDKLEEKVKVIYTVKERRDIKQEDLVRTVFSTLNDVVKLVSVSRIEKKKGYLEKLIIIEKLLADGIQITWDIVGDGNFLNEFKSIVENKKLSDTIKFHGALKHDDFQKILKQSDLFWLLSEYKESFGLVYIEAHQLGIPTIGYNKYGVKEVILNNCNGYLINESSEAVEIIKNFQACDFSSLDIIESTKRFDKKVELNKLLDCIK